VIAKAVEITTLADLPTPTDIPDVDRALLRPDEDAVEKEDRDLDQMNEEVEGLAVDHRLIDERAEEVKRCVLAR
jgi:hypothetical protein